MATDYVDEGHESGIPRVDDASYNLQRWIEEETLAGPRSLDRTGYAQQVGEGQWKATRVGFEGQQNYLQVTVDFECWFVGCSKKKRRGESPSGKET